ncbi:MAG: flagellar biosynthesis protein FlhF [Treponema sp.]|jgi:flagellar biosynthesis protein FlhF|nr:flagellar biosynthesis protein FlhF [Treponema sp.]
MTRFFIEQALTYQEAEMKARTKYGERVTILQHETVKIRGGFLNLFSQDGVKITGIIPAPSFARTAPRTQDIQTHTAKAAHTAASGATVSNFAEEKEKILALTNARSSQNAAPSSKENGAQKDGAALKQSDALSEVLAEVKTIKEKLEQQGLAGSREDHPTLNRIEDIFILNDFPTAYRKSLLDRVRKEIPLAALENYQEVQEKVLFWIGESIKIFQNDKFNVRPRIIILVGPTGVGKTTTIAKLAANFGIDGKANQKRKIALVTIDSYRIGARQQLEKYGELMDFPCYSVVDHDEMKKTIAANSESVDLFLIDTVGRNPRDMLQLAEMKQLLDACGTLAEVHLALAATTKASDILEILKQFEAFDYRSVVVTKMDETIRTGNVIGALAEKGKSISYITNGQKVPTDIRRASVVQFLINLEGFLINRIRLEERFPDDSREQMQKWR